MTAGEYARFKRFAEATAIDPDFRQRAARDPAEAARSLSLALSDPESAWEAAAAVNTGSAAEAGDNPYAAEYLRRAAVVGSYVDEMHSREAYRSQEIFLYADAVRNRCRMENSVLRGHSNIRYFPLCFELSLGCSVHCPFCGLDAGPWSADFRYTEENARLWREILCASLEILGPIAGTAACYLATEPLDNPDYERFLKDFAGIMGNVPQTTTAVADRNPERLRSLMRFLDPDRLEKQAALRFTVRSLAQFYRMAALYSPEELIGVELLANNPESLSRYSASGRVRKGKSGKDDPLAYSICCIAGLRVNMVEKRMRFIEPEIPDDDYPLGLRVREERFFSDAESFRRAAEEMTERWSVGTLSDDRPLAWNRHCEVRETAGAILFLGDAIGYRVPRNPCAGQAVQLVNDGCTLSQIREKTSLPEAWRPGFDAMMNQLYLRGYLRLR